MSANNDYTIYVDLYPRRVAYKTGIPVYDKSAKSSKTFSSWNKWQ